MLRKERRKRQIVSSPRKSINQQIINVHRYIYNYLQLLYTIYKSHKLEQNSRRALLVSNPRATEFHDRSERLRLISERRLKSRNGLQKIARSRSQLLLWLCIAHRHSLTLLQTNAKKGRHASARRFIRCASRLFSRLWDIYSENYIEKRTIQKLTNNLKRDFYESNNLFRQWK